MAILFGDGAAEFISFYSSRLKEQTRRQAMEKSGLRCEAYSPWQCAYLKYGDRIDPKLVELTYKKGDLITDKSSLLLINEFVQSFGVPEYTNMPVHPSEWPVMSEIEHERRDAISAFDEGRALVARSPFLEEIFDSLCECFVPQRRERASGFDTSYAMGAIFRTFPTASTGLLAGFQIAHGMGHQAIMMLQASDTLISSDPSEIIHYRVRNDRRTIDHALVSVVALGYMVELMKALYRNDIKPYIADEHVRGYADFLPDAVKMGLESIEGVGEYTEVGKQVVGELRELVASF
jgi:hypothetical protein